MRCRWRTGGMGSTGVRLTGEGGVLLLALAGGALRDIVYQLGVLGLWFLLGESFLCGSVVSSVGCEM